MSERDIIERLMDFDRCGLTAAERTNMRETAAMEISRLREQLTVAMTALKHIEQECRRHVGQTRGSP